MSPKNPSESVSLTGGLLSPISYSRAIAIFRGVIGPESQPMGLSFESLWFHADGHRGGFLYQRN